MAKRPNLLLFMPETLRADAVVGPPGGRAITPSFDRLADEGVSFTNAFAQMSYCTPSRCCMFTGLYPHTNGHRSIWHLLQPGERNLFQDLKEAGYRNVVFGKDDIIDASFTDACFDETALRVPRGSLGTVTPSEFTERLGAAMYTGCREGDIFNGDDACIESALQFLDEDHDKPWCLFLPLSYAHPHYQAEEPFFSMHARDAVPAPIPTGELSNKRAFKRLHHAFYGGPGMSDADLREIKATYFGMISRVDRQLGQLLDRLEQRGMVDDTVVVAFSDHGDYAGDYGLVEKFLGGFEEAMLRVPLIFRVPGTAPREVSAMCEMTDLYPTLLELVGLEPKHFHFGQTLTALMRGDAQEHRDAVFAEGGALPGEAQFGIRGLSPKSWYTGRARLGQTHKEILSRAVAIRTADHLYTYCPGDRDELFDLQRDPDCISNVADEGKYAVVKAALKERILDWLLNTSDTLPLEQGGRGWR
ncbi:MAG: sulfatase-like hydrolase/transferase [Lentisphaerae bacterium]|jgi:arylsulfatase A-like enzyme|nr:sulfatase-like hydrolase/transferase [Lentisphaerota bacterium]MBT5609805.1 sulfatase-like hydrolase/transferase [Lentisphaerota bacterium]MBT7055123.1 sulfatase-like hydrolase/transferase [Lentisphaerota bacterium]MBT7846295.1 sulfatase-like hydrolase/transferase [Lentisphaerota bacterium]